MLDLTTQQQKPLDLTAPKRSLLASQALDIAGSTSFGRGWESGSLSERVGSLMDEANNMYRSSEKAALSGDSGLAQALHQQAQSLEMQGRDKAIQAQQWAPTTQSFTDIDSAGSAVDWMAGSLGQGLRSTMPSIAGGLVGAGLGAAAAPFTLGVINPATGARIGSALGAAIPGYNMEANETIAAGMMDPGVRANKSMQEIKDTGRVKGAVAGALEAVVPAMVVGKATGLAGRVAKGDRLAAIGKSTGQGALTEFATEGAQDISGQIAENSLKDQSLSDIDPKQAFNAAMAGAVAGGGMGAMGGAAQVATGALGDGADKVNEVRKDPLGAAAYKGGKVMAGVEDWANNMLDPEYRALRRVVNSKDQAEREAAAEEYSRSVLSRPDASEEERALAAKYMNNKGGLADALYLRDHDNAVKSSIDNINGDVDKMVGKQSKIGLTDEGTTAYRLAQLWLDGDGKATKVFKHAAPKDAQNTATKLMGWIASGFGKEHTEDGKPFVLNSLVDELGDHAAPLIHQMYKLAKDQGIYRGTKQDMVDVVQAISNRHDAHTTDSNMIRKLLTPLAKADWSDRDTKVWMNHLRKSKGKVDDVNAETLRELFGQNVSKLLHHFSPEAQAERDKAVGAETKYKNPLAASEAEVLDKAAESGGELSDETMGGEVEYGRTGSSTFHVGGREVNFEGASDNAAFNTKHDDKKRDLGSKLEHYAANQHLGKDAKEVGVWDAAKERTSSDPAGRWSSEEDLIRKYGKKVDSVAKGGTVAEARDKMLAAINKQFRVVRVEDKVAPEVKEKVDQWKIDDPESVRHKFKGKRSEAVTPANGIIYLERKGSVDKETGEMRGADEAFPVSTYDLLGHAWKALGKEEDGSTLGEGAQGAKQHLDSLKKALASLIESDGTFTGRIGTRAGAGVGVKWLGKSDALPKDLKLKKGVTIKDAIDAEKKEAASKYKETRDTLAKILLNNSEESLEGFGAVIRHALDDGSTDAINSAYKKFVEMRAERRAQGKAAWNVRDTAVFDDADIVGDVVTESGAKEAVKVKTEREDVGVTQRNADGSVKGMGDDALFAAYEGNARGGKMGESRSGADSRSQADRTHDSKGIAKALEEAKHWFVEKANKGPLVLNAALKKMNEVQEVMMKKALRALHEQLSDMTPDQIQKEFYGTADGAKLKAVVREYFEKMGGSNVVAKDSGGAAGAVGQSDAVGQSKGKSGDATNDRQGVVPAAELDAGKQNTQSVEENRLIEGFEAELGQTPRKKINAIFNELKSLLDDTEVGPFGRYRFTYDANIQSAVELAQFLEYLSDLSRSLEKQMTAKQSKSIGDMSIKTYRAFEQWSGKHVADLLYSAKQNTQSVDTKQATKEEVIAAREELLRTVGDSVKLAFKKNLGGISGDWREGDTLNAIRIALNSDVLGTAYHESMHEFFNMLTKRGATATQELLKRVATNGIVTKQLEHLLYKHPEALKQMRSDPEEALAFMYQFWRAGALKLGPQTETFFDKVKGFFSRVFKMVSKEVRDQQHAEEIMRAFAEGAVADNSTRDAIVAALNEKTELHNKALEAAGTIAKRFSEHAVGKLTMTAQGMMEASGDKYIAKLAKMFHQKAGASMVSGDGWRGAYFDAVGQVNDKYQNKLANILDGMDAKDVDIVREVLSGVIKTPDIPRIKEAVRAMKALNEEMMDYIDQRNISRLDENGHWVKVERRKDFGMPQVWDINLIQNNPDAFKQDLIEHHADELAAIAAKANKEAKLKNPEGLAAKEAKEKGVEVTNEMVADAIIQRVVMSGGKVDIQESTSDLGITPLAASVNRRSLTWLDTEVFDKYKQKDLYNIYSTYIANMTKRGEYTARFGHGGEVIRDLFDRAFLNQLGGDSLVERADVALSVEIDNWRKMKAQAISNGDKFDTPYPTLREVGAGLHKVDVGEERFMKELREAVKATEPSAKAVQAMEGTLGMDITTAMRNLNSWVITYENLRLLVPSLFTSLSDVIGLTLNGGTMNDAWKAFVRGMREVKTGIVNDTKVNDADSKRAEMWGTVDAMALNDTIGQGYGSMYMTGKAKAISDKFFRKIGMESWNRSMRISATGVAESLIMRWADGQIDMKDPSEKARFERLYGEGARLQDIRLDKDGNLDVHDPKNQAAVMRFVNDAVLRPNAAMRPIWSSDPHYAMFFHLKSFTYAMHKTWLEAALNEARMGNYRPALVLLSVYLPMGIAAGAAKEMLIPGDEPPWMQGGLDSYLSYGVSKAGLGGVPQMALGAYDSAFTDLLGPAASQVRHALTDNPLKTMAAALPAGGVMQRYVGSEG